MNHNGTQAKILIVDDQPANLDILIKALEPKGYDILLAQNGEAAKKIAPRVKPDLILLDVVMPGMTGFEVCRDLKVDADTSSIPIIFLTAKAEAENILNGFQMGGVDYITKPFQIEEVLVRVKTHLENARLTRALQVKTVELTEANAQLREEIAQRRQAEDAREQAETARELAVAAKQKADEQLHFLSQQEAARWGIDGFIGKSQTMTKIFSEIRKLQHADTTSILIFGESGTGKELIARALHFGGTRKNRPFIPVNCSAIPSELAESAFFGHVRGAFTGAHTSQKGYFELADGGTLFLDEIGDMPHQLQAKLLRVLEDGYVTPVGLGPKIQIDVRVIAATNAELSSKISDGVFRQDLYYRLAGFPINVPPLRQRKDDIPLLVNHFLEIFAVDMGIGRGLERREEGEERRAEVPRISPEALEALMSYPFPGNVRELKNVIERALIESGGEVIHPENLHLLQPAMSPQGQATTPVTQSVQPSVSTEVSQLYRRMTETGESFWDVVQRPFMDRELNRLQVKQIVQRGLEDARWSYKGLLPLFGIPEDQYLKFMDFLRHHRLKPTDA